MDRQQIVRRKPRISVNKLGEYLVASPRRRRSIVQDQKQPHEFVVARYREAEEAIAKFMVDKSRDDALIHEAIERIQFKPKKTEWDQKTARLCTAALESFLDVVDKVNVVGDVVVRDLGRHPLVIGGVLVSVRPELLLRRKVDGAATEMGAVKLYFGKTKPLSEEVAAYVGAVLYEYMCSVYPDRKIAKAHCQIVDVFGGTVFTAPRAHKSRMDDVEAACEEIARAWPEA